MMKVRTYNVAIRGETPLLMHRDDIEWADEMEKWRRNPANKNASKAGDDRTPPHRWLGSLYYDGTSTTGHVVLPTDNIMRALMEGGAMVSTGKGQTTFKARTQSGCIPPAESPQLMVRGKAVPVGPFFAAKDTASYDQFQELAAQHGFDLYLKRARIGMAKHIRVRPRFLDWGATLALRVTDDAITRDVLQQILDMAGQFKGLCDWRPSSKTPGPYGMFTATVTGGNPTKED